MRCPAPPDLERAFFDGDDAIAAHASTCPKCRSVWHEIEDLANLASASRHTPDAKARERLRTILMSGATRTPTTRSWAIAVAVVAATAAALALFVVEPWRGPRGHVEANAGAHFESIGGPSDEIVLLHDGRIRVDVDDLADDERFRVRTRDAEVEVRGTSFDVTARQGLLIEVTVQEGRVEVRHDGTVAVLRRDDRWIPPAPQASVTPPPEPEPEPELQPAVERPTRRPRPKPTKPRSPEPTSAPEPPAPDHYQNGWMKLRTEDFTGAAEAFQRAIDEAQSPEDARYFLAVALGRAGRADATVGALEDFLAYHPESDREGDAAAMLGWLQFDRGAYEPARRSFERAQKSSSKRAQKSAADGLDALAAQAATTSVP